MDAFDTFARERLRSASQPIYLPTSSECGGGGGGSVFDFTPCASDYSKLGVWSDLTVDKGRNISPTYSVVPWVGTLIFMLATPV